jgi:hypothetical protein
MMYMTVTYCRALTDLKEEIALQLVIMEEGDIQLPN